MRLNRLVDAGILVRVPYQDHPPRSEYRLTEKGRDLWAVLNTMRQWGDRWAAPNGAPLELVHDGCGHVTHIEHRCAECGEPLDATSVHAQPGPAAKTADFERTRVPMTET